MDFLQIILLGIILFLVIALLVTYRNSKRFRGSLSEMRIQIEKQREEQVQEKERMEALVVELHRLGKVRKDFVANVSHELKTPLTSIKGYAETLKGGVEDAQDVARFVSKIEKNAEQLSNLIDDLLRLSELDSGQRVKSSEAVEIKTVFDAVYADFHDRIRIKNHIVESDISNILKVKIEPAALKQALSNLIDNAIKYSPEGAQIRVTALQRKHLCEIIVSDTGIGIPASDLPHIFERFYRVDKARSRDMGGTGLGLAIVKHLIKAQGGEIMVTSQPGAGSRFTMILPSVSP